MRVCRQEKVIIRNLRQIGIASTSSQHKQPYTELLLLLSHHCADLTGTASMLLVLASLSPPTPKTHSASWLRPQRATESDVRLLVGCHSKETPHCCRVALVFSNACSDQTHTGHHLLRPLLMTTLAKSQSQSEHPSRKADRLYIPPPILLSTVEASGKKGGRKTGGYKSMAWRATEAETFFLCSDQWGWGW